MACCRLFLGDLFTTRPHQHWKHLSLAKNYALAYNGNLTNTTYSSHGNRMYCSSPASCGTWLSSSIKLRHRTDSCTAHSIRKCSTLPDDKAADSNSKSVNNETTVDSDYKMVYQFSYIREMRAASMLKVYQTIVAVILTPGVVYMHNNGSLTAFEAGTMIGFTVMAAAMLFVMSNFFRKVVGYMYVSEDGTKVKIAHLTFWSRRRDLYLDLSDIVPLSDTNQKSSNAYIRLDTYSNVGKLYMFLDRGGNVIDKETLQKVLGGF